MNNDIYFSNYSLDPETYYFLYIGELKCYGLNLFLRDMFARTMDRPVAFISIIPDILHQYNYGNIMVISPMLKQLQAISGNRICFRTEPGRFMEAVSEHPAVHELIDRILEHQDHLYINMYESDPNMTLDQRDEVSILGPDKELARKFNNKMVQYEMLRDKIPVIEFETCQSMSDLLFRSEQKRQQWSDGIFVSKVYSAAGAASGITHSQADIVHLFGGDDCIYLMSRYIPHEFDPTVLAVVANEEDVYIAGVADQNIEDGNRFVGSSWPSVLPLDIVHELKEHTRVVGRELGRRGYRGIFGCDYLVDRKNNVYFLEINARKQGTTLEFCYTLEQALPPGSPSLPELEYHAVVCGSFPENTRERADDVVPLHWGTYNYKLKQARSTRGYIPQNPYERETFAKVAKGELLKDFVILEHIGSGLTVLPGTFLARIVSVARNRRDVEEGLRQGKEIIQLTIE
ncbi:ATP-grasp domain-containing protein [Desulfolithobacter sp.]